MDVPDDLTSVGRHHGNQPPTETGQEVRSPEGPDPRSTSADPSPALFQLLRDPANDRVLLRAHSPRADVSVPEGSAEEVGQYRTLEDLRAALEDLSVEERVGVFEDTEADRVATDSDVHPDHAWIGQPRFSAITFFSSEEDASAYVASLDERTTSD